MNANAARWFCLQPTSPALKVVNRVFKSSPNPLSTKEIYNLALAQKPGPSFQPLPKRDVGLVSSRRTMPPNPDHPIRSVRYLKKVILPTLEAQKKIKKVHTKLVPEEAAQPQAGVPVRSVKKNKSKTVSSSAPVGVWLWRWVAGGSGSGDAAAAAAEVDNHDADDPGVVVRKEREYRTPPDALMHLNKRRQRARLRKENDSARGRHPSSRPRQADSSPA